jgi:hypothetical protein
LEILEDNYIRHTTKMEPIVDPLLAKTDARNREIMTKMEARREAQKQEREA